MNKVAIGLAVLIAAAGARAGDLAGEWKVEGEGKVKGEVHLPGTLADAKLGRPMTAEDWRTTTDRAQLGALMRAYQYTGPATYAREVVLPPSPSPSPSPLEIFLERVMWKSTVRWDGHDLGTCDSLSTPHVHAIPAALATPGRHRLEIVVDNSRFYDFSGWAHSYGPVMQSVWHGILGRMEIRPARPLAGVRVFPSPVAERKVAVEVPQDFHAVLGETIRLEGLKATSLVEAPSPYRAGHKFVTVSLGETPVEWNEFHPTLYTLAVGDARVRFGFRQIATRGRELMLNGQSFFMRGNLDCCNFPLTGAPDMSVEGWRRIFTRLEAQGINTVRFHSWCPPEAAFVAADELGLYLAVEAAIWVDGWMKTDPVGHGKPIDGFTQRELKAILDAYGNHPSFISLGIGNELSDSEFTTMGDWLNACKKDDPRRLYFASTARKISPGDDYLVTHAYPGIGGVRCWFYPNNDWDYEKAYSRCDIPCVAHEIGQWPVYPDWGELKKYTGVLRPYNLEALYAKAVSNDTLRFNREYAFASARLNRLMYRDEVESFFRTRSCSGFQLLGVQDFSGQFEALVGWLDSFYDVKPAVRELPPFSKVSNALPHLARFGKYVWQEGETFEAKLLVRNLTDAEIPAGRAFAWSSGTHGGTFRLAAPLAVGDLAELGTVRFPLVAAERARRTLRFGENEWTFWVFPKRTACAVPESVVMTADYEEMVAALKRGARVVYVGDSNGMGSGKFKPVYWSTGFFPWGGDTATLGTWIDAAHPALAGFPTEDWADWQWQSLADGARIHRLAGLPAGYCPIVMPVPDLHYSTFLGSVFELAVGEGRLLVCGYAIENPKGTAAIALRNSILAYAAGDAFHPSAKTDFAWLADRFRPAWRDRLAPRPGEFAEAPVYIECAVGQSANGDSRWMRGNDRAEFARGTYQFDGRGFGTWKDATGTYWYGRRIDLTLKDIQPTAGELRVRFRDPNRNGRTGRGTFEGTSFDIPKHQDNPDGAYWLTLPLLREQALDGRLEFSCEALSGPNLMIDRIVIVPAPDAAAARPNLLFGVISDIHVKQRGWEDKGWDATYFHRALEWFRDQGVDGVVIAGDLADNGRADQLEAIAEAWFDVFPKGCGVEKLFVSGNHDWWGQKSVEKMDALWTRVWGEKYESVWMKRVKGYAFVGCHWEEYGSCYGAPFPKLEPFLAAHGADLGTEKPFFCIQHAHPKNTCYGSWAWGYDSGDTTRLLAPFPNAVVFSGHSHYPLTDERSIWQGAFTSIGTGSLRYMSRPDENRKGPGFENGWKGDAKVMAACAVDDVKNGMLVRVYDDEIVYERRDFQYGRKLGEDWVQPIGKRTALDFVRRRAAEPPAEFAPDAWLVANRMRAKPRKGEEVPALEVVIPPANAGKTRPFGYELRVTGTNGVRRTVQVLAEGYGQPLEDARAQGATKARISIDGLETGALEVEVLPFTSWEYDIDCNYGRPLRLKVED